MAEARLRPPLWPYWRDLPAKGETAIVFGSWYQSALRDRIYKRIDDNAFEKALVRIRRFEERLANEDVLILKFWFVLPKDVQKDRLKKIEKKNAARHVLADWAAVKHHKKASETGEKIILETSMGFAPWFVIPSQDPEYRDVALGQTVARSMMLKLEDGEPKSVAAPPVVGGLKRETAVDAIDLTETLEKADYEEQRDRYQSTLSELSDRKSMSKTGVVLVFQGNDAAGKGGAIRRVIRPLDPRIYKVHPISAPSDEEKARPYLWRFWRRLPRKGHFAIFDRSWYNRAGVERVMGFCQPNDYLEFMRQTPEFERMLVRSGIRLYKFWFSVTQAEQRRRFKARETDPLKQCKLSPIDLASLEMWDDDTEAKGAMFFYTDTADAPWTVIKSDDKKRARLNCMRYFLSTLDYPGKDYKIAQPPDPLIVGHAGHVIHRADHILGAALHPDHRRKNGTAR